MKKDKRPETDYSKPVLCPCCGEHRPEDRDEVFCRPCFNRGHYYRLMDHEELVWLANRYETTEFVGAAKMTRRYANTLE